MSATDLYIRNLLDSNPLREPLLRQIIRGLSLPMGSQALDAGCGISLQTLLHLEAIGNTEHVTGLDILPELLAYGQNLVTDCRRSEHITFGAGEVCPFRSG